MSDEKKPAPQIGLANPEAMTSRYFPESPGPYRFEDGWILDRDGNVVTRHIEANGKLLAASWEMRELLRKLEWHDTDGVRRYCPICAAGDDDGAHRPGCKLGALLARIDGGK